MIAHDLSFSAFLELLLFPEPKQTVSVGNQISSIFSVLQLEVINSACETVLNMM